MVCGRIMTGGLLYPLQLITVPHEDLADLLARQPGIRALDDWLQRLPAAAPRWQGPELLAMIVAEPT